MKSKGIVVAAILAPIVLGLWQTARLKQRFQADRQAQQELREEIEALKRARETAAVESQQREKQLADIRSKESELLRLRGENARLRSQAQKPAEVQKNASAQPTLEDTPSTVPSLATHKFNATLRVPTGQSVIAGGWKDADGKRSLTLLTPTLQPQGEGPRQVLVQSKIIAATEEAWQQLGLQNFQTEVGQEPQSGLLNADEAQTLLASVTNTPGAEIISSPRIQTSDGVEANLFIGSAPPPGDTNPAPGINLRLLPSLPSGQDAVDLKIDLTINRKTTPEDSK